MDASIAVFFAVVIIIVALASFVGLRSRSRRRSGATVEAPPRTDVQPQDASGTHAPPAPPPGPPVAPTRPAAAPPPPVKAPPETVQPGTVAPAPGQVPVPPAGIPAGPQAEAPAPGAPPQDKISRLSRGLAKTRSALGRTLSVLSRSERLDDQDWEDVEAALISADVGVKATARIVESLKRAKPAPATLTDALKAELLTVLRSSERSLHTQNGAGPAVWLVTGVNGVGKTTTIAKLAYLMQSEGRSVVLAAGDTFRAAAIDQLGTWAERVGVHMVRHAPGADPGAVVFDAIEHARARGIDIVIADTAGRLHTKSNLMEELKKVHRIAGQQAGGVSEVLLVLDATVGQNGIAQARTFKEAVSVTGLVLAKLDGSAKGGVAIAVEEELGIPVKMVGVGETLDALEPFDPREFVDALVEDR